MNGSASKSNKKSQKGLAFFDTSDSGYSSEYGLYNSSGQLLKGSEFLEQYSELAKQLDTKRSALYLQLKENEIIFGCSLNVKAENGREERVVFIQLYKNLNPGYKIESNIELLKKFYEAVQQEIESFESKKYQLVGLWNEGDFQNIKEIEIERGLKYTFGKISAGKKVSVKISDLSNGLNLVLELIAKLKKNILLVFDVSQFPSESDISISLKKPNPDFEIGENGELQNFVISESWLHFEKLGELLYKKRSAKGSQNQSAYISSIVQMIMDDPTKYFDPSNPIFKDYNDGEKVEIFESLIQKLKKGNFDDISKVLVNIYGKTTVSKNKKDIQSILFSSNIYIKEIIINLITEIYTNHNKDFFDLLFSTDTPIDNRPIISSDKTDDELEEPQRGKSSAEWYDQLDQWKEKQERKLRKTSDGSEEQHKWRDLKTGSNYSFEKGVNDVLRDMTYSQKVEFVQFITSEAPSRPREKGVFLLNRLVRDLVSKDYKEFISELNDGELENIDKILGTRHLSTKKEQKKRKIKWVLTNAFYAGVAIAIILMAFTAFNFLMGSGGDNNASIDNTNNSSISESNPRVEVKNSSSDSIENVPNSNISSSGEGVNNSSSENGEITSNSSGTLPVEGSTSSSGNKLDNSSNLADTSSDEGANNSSS